MKSSSGILFLSILFAFQFACNDGERNYKKVVVEKSNDKTGKKANWAVREGDFQMTGPIVIQNFNANLVLKPSQERDLIRISVAQEFRSDSAFYPQVRQGRNQVIIMGNPELPKEAPEWVIELPERFELSIDGMGYSTTGKGLVGVLILKNQGGDVNLDSCSGAFEILSQEGSIFARDIDFQGRSKFTTNQGDVLISLSRDLDYELAVNSGSGNVSFFTGDYGIIGSIKTVAKDGLNGISSKWEPDSTGTFISSGLDIKYEFQLFKFKGIQPETVLGSGSGKVILAKSVNQF